MNLRVGSVASALADEVASRVKALKFTRPLSVRIAFFATAGRFAAMIDRTIERLTCR